MNIVPPSAATAIPATLGWRLLAALYDLLPVLALWMLLSAVVLTLRGNQPLAAWSAGQWLLWLGCWAITGLYFVVSWLRGGQTLGMRPWRLRVCDQSGNKPAFSMLCLRYAMASVSLLVFGLGFLWSLFDPERRTWHDIVSGTRLLRLPKLAKA
jgi:uncharacterized RDD family membrane protein YckC